MPNSGDGANGDANREIVEVGREIADATEAMPVSVASAQSAN